MNASLKEILPPIAEAVGLRVDLMVRFAVAVAPHELLEVGVYKGDLAEPVLKKCTSIVRYHMVDPWRNLSDWNKPANKKDDEFERIYEATMERTAFARERRVVHRGKTSEVIHELEDGSIDLAYIDGDHTLRGIITDLLFVLPKMKSDGYLCGDDLVPSLWQHDLSFEPTMVFPVAVHFAEGIDRKIYLLPHQQFVIALGETGFEVVNMSGKDHSTTDILPSIRASIADAVARASVKSRLIRKFPRLYKVYQRIRG